MRRLLIITMLIMVFIVGCTSAYKKPQEAPEIKIYLMNEDQKEEIPSFILLNQWNGAIYDRMSSLQWINEMYKEGAVVPKGKVGQKVTIDFGEYKPDQVRLMKEYRLLEDEMYTKDSMMTEIELKKESETKFSYSLPQPNEEAPTHQYVFTITANWGNNSADYAFCVEVIAD